MHPESFWIRWRSKQPKLILLLSVCIASFVFFKSAFHNDSSSPLSNYNHDAHRHLKAKKTNSPEPREYTYIIIHYHKTGHDLTRSLVDMISGGIPGVSKPTVWTRRTMLSVFDKDSRVCSRQCIEHAFDGRFVADISSVRLCL